MSRLLARFTCLVSTRLNNTALFTIPFLLGCWTEVATKNYLLCTRCTCIICPITRPHVMACAYNNKYCNRRRYVYYFQRTAARAARLAHSVHGSLLSMPKARPEVSRLVVQVLFLVMLRKCNAHRQPPLLFPCVRDSDRRFDPGIEPGMVLLTRLLNILRLVGVAIYCMHKLRDKLASQKLDHFMPCQWKFIDYSVS